MQNAYTAVPGGDLAMHTPSLAQVLAAIDAAIAGGADDWQAPADWQPGDPDGCWDHPAAAEARRLTAAAGMRWDFTTWADAREVARAYYGEAA